MAKKRIINKKQPENYDMILDWFKDNKKVKCLKCKKILKEPMDCRYIFPGCFCKKCYKIRDRENSKTLSKAFKEIGI